MKKKGWESGATEIACSANNQVIMCQVRLGIYHKPMKWFSPCICGESSCLTVQGLPILTHISKKPK
jgi:hypothetical protein